MSISKGAVVSSFCVHKIVAPIASSPGSTARASDKGVPVGGVLRRSFAQDIANRLSPNRITLVGRVNWPFKVAAFLNPWTLGVVFQVLMVVHFIRHRPEGYWFWVILFFGPIGAAVYFFFEVLPGLQWKIPVIDRWERRRRRQWLERMVSESPTQEGLSELAWSCGKDGEHRRAMELFSEALERDPGDLDSLYWRGLSAIELSAYEDAVKDLRALAQADPKYKLHKANLVLATAYEGLGDEDKAIEVFRSILDNSPISRAYCGLAELLAKRGEAEQAREMMQAILAKQVGLPRYLRRQERLWVWRARRFLKTLSA